MHKIVRDDYKFACKNVHLLTFLAKYMCAL